MTLTKHKLTPAGEALVSAGKDPNSKTKGTLRKGGKTYDLSQLTDDEASELLKPDGKSPYVQAIDSKK